ncbi:MAG: Holliday junction resolvase RuvX [Acidimicrobiales bacterium]
MATPLTTLYRVVPGKNRKGRSAKAGTGGDFADNRGSGRASASRGSTGGGRESQAAKSRTASGRTQVGQDVVAKAGEDRVAADRIALYREILDIAAEYEAGWIIVGLPINMDGSEGPAARSAQSEAAELAALAERYGIKVALVDERLTSSHSMRSLSSAGLYGKRSRQVVDQVAASVLLQSWLDTQRSGRASGSSGALRTEVLDDPS